MDEMKVDPAQLAEWKQTRDGAIIGDRLAKTFGVKIGDKLVVDSNIYPGDWELKVVGIYTPLRQTADRNTLVFRWDYLTDDPRGVYSKDQAGWVLSRIDDPAHSADIATAIDRKFEEKADQTLTMSERTLALSYLGAFSALLSAFDLVSLVILLVMVLVLTNTIAMAVRERTHEYGVLLAIGFSPGQLRSFIIGEAVLVALVGGVLGVVLTFGLLNGVIGPYLEDNMTSMFRYFHTSMNLMWLSLACALVVGVIAGVLPAMRVSRLKVTDALRRLD
jgi:putative ABC transport system permease protein